MKIILLSMFLSFFIINCNSQKQIIKTTKPQNLIEKVTVIKENDSIFYSIHINTPTDERNLFGIDLRASKIISIQFKATLLTTHNKSNFIYRRQDMKMFFTNGISRYSLDPAKINERNRINLNTAAFSFGLLGAISAQSLNKERSDTFLKVAFHENSLNEKQNSFSGILFFDISDIPDAVAKTLSIEIENETTSDIEISDINLY